MASKVKTVAQWTELKDTADVVAKRLLGSILEREIDGETVTLKIVETEAYDQTDAASHSFNGRTPRVETMFGPAGFSYVYFTYGMHYCCNIVTGEEGFGSGVLVRAVEPISGTEVMEKRRGGKTGKEVCNGPAKLCQALGIDGRLNGHDLTKAPLKLHIKPKIRDNDIVTTTRIGISKATDVHWRFYIKDSSYVSVKAKDDR